MTVEVEELKLKDLVPDPLWMNKFKHWATMQKSCMAARGPNGIYCSWEGRNCGYSHCPRRIFEEVSIDPNTIQGPQPKPKIRTQIQVLQNTAKEQKELITKLNERIEILEKKEN